MNPQLLIEYAENKKLINNIIDDWFKDYQHLLLDDKNEPTLNRAIIVNCMISYRKLMQGY